MRHVLLRFGDRMWEHAMHVEGVRTALGPPPADRRNSRREQTLGKPGQERGLRESGGIRS